MTARELCREAERRGLRLKSCGDKLAVTPANLLQPDFAEQLRQHKREILALLACRKEGISPDRAPWLHVAAQILSGEFDGADHSTSESLAMGLRSVSHPLTARALLRLKI